MKQLRLRTAATILLCILLLITPRSHINEYTAYLSVVLTGYILHRASTYIDKWLKLPTTPAPKFNINIPSIKEFSTIAVLAVVATVLYTYLHYEVKPDFLYEQREGFSSFLTSIVLAPIVEEFSYRRVIFHLDSTSPRRLIKWLSLFFFVIAHSAIQVWIGVIPAALIFVSDYYKHKNVCRTILLHATYNLFVSLTYVSVHPMQYVNNDTVFIGSLVVYITLLSFAILTFRRCKDAETMVE